MEIKGFLNVINKIKTYLALCAFVAVLAYLIIHETLTKTSEHQNIVLYMKI